MRRGVCASSHPVGAKEVDGCKVQAQIPNPKQRASSFRKPLSCLMEHKFRGSEGRGYGLGVFGVSGYSGIGGGVWLGDLILGCSLWPVAQHRAAFTKVKKTGGLAPWTPSPAAPQSTKHLSSSGTQGTVAASSAPKPLVFGASWAMTFRFLGGLAVQGCWA